MLEDTHKQLIMDILRAKMYRVEFLPSGARVTTMCDPIYVLRRINRRLKKDSIYAGSTRRMKKKEIDNRDESGLCICPHDIVVHQGCKCGGK